ncbi:CIC11C00000004254 [Sungouiella intermedia]|uniref:CIC11C00000004254 n=1 Tax=Sungouiella intermedia TaxID=45354 RepID=A0A1L0DLB1_9ASCO|nr:CIC11C00000004254 [[Candida] intermedia]
MTIQFVPGDPNRSINSLYQAQWRNHRIIAYGSGNNLIIYTITDNGNPNLQTVYLDRDPVAVCINGDNGLICISHGVQVLALRPVNEYMAIPKWTEAQRLDIDETEVLCMKWAVAEQELVVGTSKGIHLLHLYIEYGEIKSNSRWFQEQASPVEGIDITADASKIVSYNYTNYDSFAKVFVRINYGDSNSLFELIYLDHERSKWLLSFKWREKRQVDTSEINDDVLASIANIKNIRSYMPTSSESNDILYTITNDHVLNVWATYDFSGHSHLKLWAELDLKKDLKSDFKGALVIENVKLQSTLIAELAESTSDTEVKKHFEGKNMFNFDLVLALGSTKIVAYAVWNIDTNPPNNVLFEKIRETDIDRTCLPSYLVESLHDLLSVASDADFHLSTNPVTLGNTIVLEDTHRISYLVHDRLKNTIRLVEGSFRGLIEGPGHADVILKNKFQGHTKSIRRLVTSSSSYKNNIMLSISNFPSHNYIWEPLFLDPGHQKCMSITKRFRLNVTRKGDDIHNQGIVDAILINDVTKPKGHLRHHIAVVVEKGGYFSIWDCDGETMDDKDAKLIDRIEILDSNNDKITVAPRALFLNTISKSTYIVICAYDNSVIKAWKIDIDSDGRPSYSSVKADVLPGKYSGEVVLSAVDTFLEKDLSIIDETGLFRLIGVSYREESNKVEWNQITQIHTNIEKASYIRGASVINKLAIVNEEGDQLTIWDTKSGHLEYEESFPKENGKIWDLDWTFIGSMGSTAHAILGVGFPRFVMLYTQLRYDYTNKVPTFALLKKIDISDYTSHEIGDLIWIDEGYMVIGSGNQFFIDDKWVQLADANSTSSNRSIDSTIRQLMVGYDPKQNSFMISDLVRILNGPLPVYHPQFLIQALLQNEVKLVEEVLVKLLQVLRTDGEIKWDLGVEFMDAVFHSNSDKKRRRVSFVGGMDFEVFDEFNSTVLDLLVEKLTKVSLPLLTRHQQTTLITVTNIVNNLSKYKGSMDENGMKFLLGLELFQSSLKQKHLPMRDISWALHSDQKEMLFSTVDNLYQHRLSWEQVRKVGLAYWVDKHRLTNLVETIARNEFGDSRDPSGRVSVLYLAIKKKQVLVGLWRTVYHPEKDKVLKFLSNNFAEDRWKTAALKNAFVLLGKHRYIDAAYFFLLAGQVRDCCITLCNKVRDIELALVVAKVNSDKETIMHIIENFILPHALMKGDRWMTSWVFWEMKQKEISIQALIKSPIHVVKEYVTTFSQNFQKTMETVVLEAKSKSFIRDDPVLAVLFQNLRSSKLNYLQGSRAVKPDEEFEFVIKVSTIYSRMGCDYLALLLMKNWKFLEPVRNKVEVTSEAKDLFLEFSAAPKETKVAPAPSTFEEPDMSAFNFGF